MRNWIFTLTFAAVSATAVAATPFELKESERWAIQNVLDGEYYAIISEGKANIIDTPDITMLDKLYGLFRENEIAVVKNYKDKPRLLTFPVGRVALENGVPVVYGAWSSPTVRYVFDSNSADALSHEGQGSRFPAVCSLLSITNTALEFRKCRAAREDIKNHIAARRSEILDFLAGLPAKNAKTPYQAITLMSRIFSMSRGSTCFMYPSPELYCLSQVEFQGKSLIDDEVRKAVVAKFRSLGFQF